MQTIVYKLCYCFLTKKELVLKKYPSILVCVTQQKNCANLIKFAAEYTVPEGKIHVLHVSNKTFQFFENIREGEALEFLFETSKLVGAELTVINASQVPETIAQFAEHMEVSCILLGSPGKESSGLGEKMSILLQDSAIDIESVSLEDL